MTIEGVNGPSKIFALMVITTEQALGYLSLFIYYSKFAKGRFQINPIQKKLENLYLIIDSSDFKSVFSIQLQTD